MEYHDSPDKEILSSHGPCTQSLSQDSDDLSSKTISELKDILRGLKQPTSGDKDTLVERILSTRPGKRAKVGNMTGNASTNEPSAIPMAVGSEEEDEERDPFERFRGAVLRTMEKMRQDLANNGLEESRSGFILLLLRPLLPFLVSMINAHINDPKEENQAESDDAWDEVSNSHNETPTSKAVPTDRTEVIRFIGTILAMHFMCVSSRLKRKLLRVAKVDVLPDKRFAELLHGLRFDRTVRSGHDGVDSSEDGSVYSFLWEDIEPHLVEYEAKAFEESRRYLTLLKSAVPTAAESTEAYQSPSESMDTEDEEEQLAGPGSAPLTEPAASEEGMEISDADWEERDFFLREIQLGGASFRDLPGMEADGDDYDDDLYELKRQHRRELLAHEPTHPIQITAELVVGSKLNYERRFAIQAILRVAINAGIVWKFREATALLATCNDVKGFEAFRDVVLRAQDVGEFVIEAGDELVRYPKAAADGKWKIWRK